jgi:glycerophosphoryl diester phosphodiesterase
MPYLTLPNEIGDFANFTLEADFQPVSITDNNRWSAIKLRMQEQGYPYYRVAVRYLAKSSGGVFTEYINDVGTAVNKKDYSYIDNIILNKNYKLKLEVYGQKARFFIDDDFVMEMDYLNLLEKGTLGFEVSGMRVFLDNIKVTLKEKPIPEKLGAYIVDVQEPETSISMAPTLMAEIETKDILNSLKGDVKPASALMYLNNKLILTSKAGDREIAPIDDAFEVLGKNIIPVFYVNDTATASALIKFIKRESIIDYSVMSSDANIIKLIRSEYYMARGILDCSNLSELNDGILHDIIQKAVESGSRTLVLPQSLAAKDTVEALQNKLLEVYTKAEPRIDSAMKIHGIINSSVNGIITDSFEKFISAYSKYTGTNSVTRSTKIIGHRGVSSLAPENTIAGFKLAKELGASIIETDLYITKDNHIVAMHDPLIERTTNGSGNIENMTLAELKQFVVNKQFPGKFLDERIPTLQEILDYIRGTDCSIILEIKSEQPRLIDELARVLNQVENKDNIIVGCFDQTKLKAVGGKVPDVKLLWFNGWVAIDTKLEESLRNSLDGVQFYEAGFGPDYTTVGPKFLEASKHRNIQTWVWTINDNQSLNSFMAMGVHGITTDYVQFASEYARRVEPVQGSYTLKNMEAVQLKGKVTAYNGEVKEVIAVPVVLDGEDNVEVNGDYLIAKKPGTSVVMLRYSQPMGDSEYNIYSEPFEITIQTEQYPDPVITSSASGVTNKDVVVKSEKLVRFVVNGNEDLMPSKEKTISTEGVFEVYGKDLAGRESNRVTFTIDKTAPVITGVEDNTVYTRPVNITFTDNSAITAMLNGNVVTSGITVSEEGTYILEITDEAGNKTVCNFFIKNTVPVISSRTVRIDKVNGRITKLEEGTTVTEFKNSFSIQNGTIKVFDSSGKEVTEGNIGTGFKLVEEYTVIIYGDINNDGKINSLDLMKVKKHILELETVNGANLTAADVNKDNSLNSLDLMFIKQHTLEKKKIAQ